MGKLTQYLDYLHRDPKDLTADFIIFNYTHISIGNKEKQVRRREKLYQNMPQDLFSGIF